MLEFAQIAEVKQSVVDILKTVIANIDASTRIVVVLILMPLVIWTTFTLVNERQSQQEWYKWLILQTQLQEYDIYCKQINELEQLCTLRKYSAWTPPKIEEDISPRFGL